MSCSKEQGDQARVLGAAGQLVVLYSAKLLQPGGSINRSPLVDDACMTFQRMHHGAFKECYVFRYYDPVSGRVYDIAVTQLKEGVRPSTGVWQCWSKEIVYYSNQHSWEAKTIVFANDCGTNSVAVLTFAALCDMSHWLKNTTAVEGLPESLKCANLNVHQRHITTANLLYALLMLVNKGIIHCDVKPGNVLMYGQCVITVDGVSYPVFESIHMCDFGSHTPVGVIPKPGNEPGEATVCVGNVNKGTSEYMYPRLSQNNPSQAPPSWAFVHDLWPCFICIFLMWIGGGTIRTINKHRDELYDMFGWVVIPSQRIVTREFDYTQDQMRGLLDRVKDYLGRNCALSNQEQRFFDYLYEIFLYPNETFGCINDPKALSPAKVQQYRRDLEKWISIFEDVVTDGAPLGQPQAAEQQRSEQPRSKRPRAEQPRPEQATKHRSKAVTVKAYKKMQEELVKLQHDHRLGETKNNTLSLMVKELQGTIDQLRDEIAELHRQQNAQRQQNDINVEALRQLNHALREQYHQVLLQRLTQLSELHRR